MIDYSIDSTSLVTTLDNSATDLFNNIVANLLSYNRTLTPQCKERLRDFACANEFPKCDTVSFTSPSPYNVLEHICKDFCNNVVETCGGFFPGGNGGCDSFNSTLCITIEPSSRKPCALTSQCDIGEYCYMYGSTGVCLQRPE